MGYPQNMGITLWGIGFPRVKPNQIQKIEEAKQEKNKKRNNSCRLSVSLSVFFPTSGNRTKLEENNLHRPAARQDIMTPNTAWVSYGQIITTTTVSVSCSGPLTKTLFGSSV